MFVWIIGKVWYVYMCAYVRTCVRKMLLELMVWFGLEDSVDVIEEGVGLGKGCTDYFLFLVEEFT